MSNVKNIKKSSFRCQSGNSLSSQIELATEKLASWANGEKYNKKSFSTYQNYRYVESCDLLDRIQGAARKAGLVMNLFLPEDAEPVATYRMRKSTDDFVILKSSIELEPITSFNLSEQTADDYKEFRSVIYFGNKGRFVEVADLARSLITGGEIQLVSIGE